MPNIVDSSAAAACPSPRNVRESDRPVASRVKMSSEKPMDASSCDTTRKMSSGLAAPAMATEARFNASCSSFCRREAVTSMMKWSVAAFPSQGSRTVLAWSHRTLPWPLMMRSSYREAKAGSFPERTCMKSFWTRRLSSGWTTSATARPTMSASGPPKISRPLALTYWILPSWMTTTASAALSVSARSLSSESGRSMGARSVWLIHSYAPTIPTTRPPPSRRATLAVRMKTRVPSRVAVTSS